MLPITFPQVNAVLGRPSDMTPEQCNDLPIARGTMDGFPAVVSCWEFTAEELEQVKETGKIYLVAVGITHPPISLRSQNPFE